LSDYLLPGAVEMPAIKIGRGRAVSRPSDRPRLSGFGHGGHSLFIGGQPLVSHLDFDGEFCDDA